MSGLTLCRRDDAQTSLSRLQLVPRIPTAIRSPIFSIGDGALLAAEVAAVNIQIPCTIGAMGLAIEGSSTVFLRRTTGDILGMRAEGALGTADSIRRNGLAAVDLRGQARAVLAQGPSKVSSVRQGGERDHARRRPKIRMDHSKASKPQFWECLRARTRQNRGRI